MEIQTEQIVDRAAVDAAREELLAKKAVWLEEQARFKKLARTFEKELRIKATDAAEAGIAGSFAHASEEVKALAWSHLEEYAITHEYLSAFEVTSLLAQEDVHISSLTFMGAIMRKAAKTGLIESTGEFQPNKRGHDSPARIWRSLVFRGAEVSCE